MLPRKFRVPGPHTDFQLCLPERPWVRKIALFNGIPITERPLEERCRAVRVINIQTGRVVAFEKLKDGRAIEEGATHLESLMPKVGLEPTPSCEDRILSPARLPSPTHWKQVAVVLKV